ncbi:uncharacterized protein A4U43_C07F4000 [Asparagus officinalis]|uniref:NAF domain-containing protein n=1 Tax=Asparagus officinalis TaxID=4686 RepID=A0A5P1E9C3_ASPOF|nr:uncharacterized protein A4U43_C07F4000 [Asparagus officinalis]
MMRDPWFKKGLDREKWTAMMRFQGEEEEEKDEGEEREMNAFDLISFSSGVNLSGLFEPGADRERRYSAL